MKCIKYGRTTKKINKNVYNKHMFICQNQSCCSNNKLEQKFGTTTAPKQIFMCQFIKYEKNQNSHQQKCQCKRRKILPTLQKNKRRKQEGNIFVEIFSQPKEFYFILYQQQLHPSYDKHM